MPRPFFSIIVPVYNTAAEYLRMCIESLRTQSFSDTEILIVDDGSGADCAKMCDSLAAGYENIRVIHQKNSGISEARNAGIRAATGEWILFVDSDDWIEPDACARLYGHLNSSDYDILFFNLIREFSGRQEPARYTFIPGTVYDFSDTDTREAFYLRAMKPSKAGSVKAENLTFSWDKAYRRRFLAENGLFFEPGLRKYEDKEFMLRCFQKLGRLFYSGEPLYHYRINEQSVCRRYSATADADRAKLYNCLCQRAQEMDHELSELKGAPYSAISDAVDQLMFGYMGAVLLLKYYHPDNPDKKTRRRDAIAFLSKSPYKEILQNCRYGSLTCSQKLKKFMLENGLVSTFCRLKLLQKRLESQPMP